MPQIVHDLLTEISLILFEPLVDTVLILDSSTTGPPPPDPDAPRPSVVTPASMENIFAGAQLMLGSGATREAVTVDRITPSTFSARMRPHLNREVLRGAVFPSGQNLNDPLFTQQEMLGYVARVQNDFLTKTQAVVAIAEQRFTKWVDRYPAPAEAIRLERISVQGSSLKNTSQDSLGLAARDLPPSKPRFWFQDKLNVAEFGVYPAAEGDPLPGSLWYTQRGPASLGVGDPFLVPEPMVHILKYGVLEIVLSKDGEMRDPSRAQHAGERYKQSLELVTAFLEGVQAQLAQLLEEGS